MAQSSAKKAVLQSTKILPVQAKVVLKRKSPRKISSSKMPLHSKKESETKTFSRLHTKKPLQKGKAAVTSKAQSITPTSLHRSSRTKVKIKDNTKTLSISPVTPKSQLKAQSLTIKKSIFPAVLSPFRFPLLKPALLSNVARVAGVFFVATGAVLSLLNFSPMEVAQHATVVETAPITPEARISIEAGTTFANTIPITITVPLATDVKVIALQKSTNQQFSLGSADAIDDTTWSYSWDTLPFTDGEYALTLLIKNQYGEYQFSDGTVYNLANHFETQSSEQAVEPLPSPIVLQILEDSPIHGSVTFKINALGAREVKVVARNSRTYAIYYIGTATLHDDGEWRLDWNSEKVPDGRYYFHAKVSINETQIQTTDVTASVDNIDELQSFEVNANTETSSSTSSSNEADDPVRIATTTIPEKQIVESLKPFVELSFSEASPLSKFTDIQIKTSKVEWVELYAVSKSSLIARFLGLALPVAEGDWTFAWDTRQSPNGEYTVYARIKTTYGFVESSHTSIRVLNETLTSFTPEQEDSIYSYNAVQKDLIRNTSEIPESDFVPDTVFEAPKVVYIQSTESFLDTLQLNDSLHEEYHFFLTQFNSTLLENMRLLATAIRNDDDATIAKLNTDIEKLKQEILTRIAETGAQKDIIESIDTYLSKLVFEMQDLTRKNESILKERFGEDITKDSDKDDVSDYDEINLYHTNSFSADTDGDGYIDSVEIQLGYNPHDSDSEALVMYESPKETGIVRDDILHIESISALASTEINTGSTSTLKALISGKGLPNSFVTLYIFSTPIVMTVRTTSDGSWSYIFDKELEEGNHEIYVGITDNAGRIVAKSNPLPFVKTAEAFTTEDQAYEEGAVSAPGIFVGSSMLLVGSIAVSALGLVLILLGLHANRKEEDAFVPQMT